MNMEDGGVVMEAESVMRPVSPEYVVVKRSVIEELLGALGGGGVPGLMSVQSYDNFDPDELYNEFKDACEIDYRLHSRTVCERTRHVKRLLEFLGKHPLLATRQDLRQFLRFDPAQNAVKAVRVLYGRFLGSDLASCFKAPQSPIHMVIAPSKAQLWQTYENLNDLELEAAFLLFSTSALRRHELIELTRTQIDFEKRMILPPSRNNSFNTTKFQWITFFNDEAGAKLRELISARSPGPDERIFRLYKDTLTRKFKEASPSDFKITPQILRDWFSNEMGRLGVQDRYVDAFCGRIPRKVLGRHYTDYSPENLKEIYDKAGLKVFEGFNRMENQTSEMEVKG